MFKRPAACLSVETSILPIANASTTEVDPRQQPLRPIGAIGFEQPAGAAHRHEADWRDRLRLTALLRPVGTQSRHSWRDDEDDVIISAQPRLRLTGAGRISTSFCFRNWIGQAHFAPVPPGSMAIILLKNSPPNTQTSARSTPASNGYNSAALKVRRSRKLSITSWRKPSNCPVIVQVLSDPIIVTSASSRLVCCVICRSHPVP